jgi:hypothetical protein
VVATTLELVAAAPVATLADVIAIDAAARHAALAATRARVR